MQQSQTTTARCDQWAPLNPHSRSQFEGEYHDGSSPTVAAAVHVANNRGSESAYNEGQEIEDAKHALISQLLPGTQRCCHIEFLPGGTGANKAVLEQFCTRKFHGLIGADIAHVFQMEQNAVNATPIRVRVFHEGPQAGCIDPDDLDRVLSGYSWSMHTTRPVALTITNPNEYGVRYDSELIEQISQCVKEFRDRGNVLFLHLDCSRIHNVFALDESGETERARWLLEMADGATVGMNKNGGPDCDAAVFLKNGTFDESWIRELRTYLKSTGLHASRGWADAAGVQALFENGLYFKNARNANYTASVLCDRLTELEKYVRIDVKYEVQTNAVFIDVDDKTVLNDLAKKWKFSVGLPGAHARFICSWKTETSDVHELADDIEDLMVGRLKRRQVKLHRNIVQ